MPILFARQTWLRCAFVLGVATSSLGLFVIDTPESRAETERQEAAHRKKIESRLDLRAVRQLLIAQLKAHPVVDGVDLRPARVGFFWHKFGTSFSCGDWLLSADDPDLPEFKLTWSYQTLSPRPDRAGYVRSIEIICLRDSKKTFTVRSIRKIEDELVLLSLAEPLPAGR
jgi:hypothetical protein